MEENKYFYVVGVYAEKFDPIINDTHDTFFDLEKAKEYAKELEAKIKRENRTLRRSDNIITLDIERFDNFNADQGEVCDLSTCRVIQSTTLYEGREDLTNKKVFVLYDNDESDCLESIYAMVWVDDLEKTQKEVEELFNQYINDEDLKSITDRYEFIVNSLKARFYHFINLNGGINLGGFGC